MKVGIGSPSVDDLQNQLENVIGPSIVYRRAPTTDTTERVQFLH